MAVPKKKTSVSRKGKRRAGQHHKLYTTTTGTCPTTGEYTRPHCVSPAGYYKDRQIFEIKERKDSEEQAAE